MVQFSCLSEADLTACVGVTCLNGGVCMGGMLGQCLCQPGWGGSNCSQKLNYTPCFGVNCGYYGICDTGSAEAGGAKCQCLDGYTGDVCTQPPSNSPCSGVDCGAHGICKNGLCECSSGFTGCTCEVAPNCTLVANANYAGSDLPNGGVSATSPADCCTKCQQTASCEGFTYNLGSCYLKSSTAQGTTPATGQTAGALPTTVTLAPQSCYGALPDFSQTRLSLQSSFFSQYRLSGTYGSAGQLSSPLGQLAALIGL